MDHLNEEIRKLRVELHENIAPLLATVRELGLPEQVRARVQFIELLIEREKDRTKLRRAIIEKSLIGAVWALLVFLAVAVWNEIKRH